MSLEGPRPRALFRCSPEDFVVDEIPAYSPSGKGEHLFVTIRKTGWTTLDAVRRLSSALEVDPRGAGFAGMKDKHAVTTQTLSFPLPIARSPEEALGRASELAAQGIEILGFSRHENKLKPGHLLGNRFRIALRGLDAEGLAEVKARLEAIRTTGVPNAFGPQRFGRDGENPERALAFVRGETRGPRDRREQRLLFSSLQSLWFNRVLEAREAQGTWSAVLPGDLAKKHDTGGLFLVPAEGPDLADAEERAKAGGISPTGPMFGAKMRWPEGTPRDIERRVLDEVLGNPERLEGLRHLGEGTRRALRIMVNELTVETLGETQSGHSLAVRFVLPKGGYATTVLARACDLVETRGAAREDSPGADAAGPGDEDAANDD
jgi:tRNA pseudouridine13 synthase